MNFFLQRLREPSTYLGISALLTMAGVALPPGTVEAVAQIGAGVAAVAGVVMPEKGQP